MKSKVILKNIGAIIAGFLVTLFLTRGMDILLETIGVFPSVEEQKKNGFNVLWMNIVALLYRFGFAIIGGYITARLSANKPMKNVNILAIFGTIIAIAANIAISQIPEMANVLPLWFSVALVVIAFPSVWLGGRFALNKK
ncbi:MAG TPA: hypothetical protein VGD17_05415 [Chitinophagaceae bacterium]